MNLNIEVISHELQKNYTVSCSLKSGKTPLSSPMLYDGTAFRKKHVYIIEAADLALLEESPADIALIVIGVSPFRSDSGSAIFCLSGKTYHSGLFLTRSQPFLTG